MKSTQLAASLFAAFALVATVSAHADVNTQSAHGIQSNGVKLNGVMLNGTKFNSFRFNGLNLNGPGLVVQARNFNGPGLVVQARRFNGPGLILQGRFLNGPGIVLQGRMFNGYRMNGNALAGFDVRADQLTLLSSEACSAPQPAREWPLSALHASSVTVRLAPR